MIGCKMRSLLVLVTVYVFVLRTRGKVLQSAEWLNVYDMNNCVILMENRCRLNFSCFR